MTKLKYLLSRPLYYLLKALNMILGTINKLILRKKDDHHG